MTVDEVLRGLRFFLPMRDADGDPLPLLTGGGCDSRSNSADEAASRALSELASFEPSPAAAFDVEAASSGFSARRAGVLDDDDDALESKT